ncbi:MAG: response regulator [Gemmatimonadota bacterium]
MATRTILVVEDEPIVALDLQQRLQKMGYHVPAVARLGEDVVDLAAGVKPDLVLMDISLGGNMDGVEVAEHLRVHCRIPVVYLTAYSHDAILERAKATEPYGYLLKPFEERELQTTIEIALYKHQAEEALRRANDDLERRVAERTEELEAANRSLQMEIADRRRREARRLAVARVREQVWRMRGTQDLQAVLAAICEGLRELGVPFRHCTMNVVDASASPPAVRVYGHSESGMWHSPALAPPAVARMIDLWRSAVPVYRRDLEREDLRDERQSIARAMGPARSVLDVPFSHGTLAVNSPEPEAFSEPHISVVEELAGALSEGFRRLQDLQELAAERERLAVTLRSIGESVAATDAEGRVALLNRVAESLTGWTQGEARGRAFEEVFCLVDERTGERCASPVGRVLLTGAAAEPLLNTVLVGRDGTRRPIATSSAPILDDQGRTAGAVLVSRDVAVERRMEEELLRSEKLESLGVLAGGIAHDFNNILTTIVGYLSLAKLDIDPDTRLYQHLAEVEDAADRAAGLTHQLLAFAKGGAPVKTTASVVELITDSATFATRGSSARCDFALAADLWVAELDRGQMSQVIQNLVLNASQAMLEGGTIEVRGRNVDVGPEQGVPLEPGRYILISVADRGVGIDPEHLPRIFDPYYTTKPKGSGLGLATAYAIVRNHGGHIAVESSPGEGATFTIYLPASDRVPGPLAAAAAGGVVQGSGRVLVLDDQESIRRLAMDMLTQLGYEAELAADGRQAVARYRAALASERPFDAVIMDLTVPGGMGGKEAVRRLLEMDPQARVIVSSGYSEDPVMADFAKYGFSGVVAKPYQIRELSQVLNSVTGAAKP